MARPILRQRCRAFSQRYHLGGERPLVDHSIPNVEFEEGKSIDEVMRDGQALLLDFNRNTSLKIAASEYGDRSKYLSGRAKNNWRWSLY